MIVPTRRTRRGYSLIEMILVIGGVTIIIGVCGTLLHALLRLDKASRANLNETVSLSRLARQFRQDVRAGLDARPGKDGRMELTEPDGVSIVYHVEGNHLLREENAGKTLRRREAFAVDRLGPVGFEVDETRVRLVLSRRPEPSPALARPVIHIEARLGKDRTPTALAEAHK